MCKLQEWIKHDDEPAICGIIIGTKGAFLGEVKFVGCRHHLISSVLVESGMEGEDSITKASKGMRPLKS